MVRRTDIREGSVRALTGPLSGVTEQPSSYPAAISYQQNQAAMLGCTITGRLIPAMCQQLAVATHEPERNPRQTQWADTTPTVPTPTQTLRFSDTAI